MESTQKAPDLPEPPQHRFVILFASSAALAFAANLLLYGQRPGLGLALFFALLWSLLAIFRRPAGSARRDSGRLLGILLVAGTMATLIAPSTANLLLLIALTLYASGHWLHRRLSPYWARLLEGVAGFVSMPTAVKNLRRGFDEMWHAAGGAEVRRGAGWLARMLRIVLPVALLLLPFLILLGGGNAVLGTALQDGFLHLLESIIRIEPPSVGRLVFCLFIAACAFSLLGNPLPRLYAGAHPPAPKNLAPPADRAVAVWRIRLLLLGANGLFLMANAADVRFLWGGASLPDGINYSEFVHRGTTNLIACTLLAGVVLAALFRGPKEVTGAIGQRALAILWIVQNIALAAGVAQRLRLYVDAYGMSVLRVHLLLFLALVAVGFVLLAIYIARARPLRWLIGANVLAVFGLFFIGQFLNVRGLVANHNVRAAIEQPERAADLDLRYLRQLTPESWPALAQIAAHPKIFDHRAAVARNQLTDAARREAKLAHTEDWRAWSWRRHRLRQGLPGFPQILATVQAEFPEIANR